jgi:iron-sulfur cluster insertion protein
MHTVRVEPTEDAVSETLSQAPETDSAPAASQQPTFGLTENAARRINELITAENDPNLMLRVAVHGGGCSGFRYSFDFDRAVNEDDHTFSRDGVSVVVDDVSLELLAGSQLEFVEDLIGSYFEVQNPNASSSCGCGASFSI